MPIINVPSSSNSGSSGNVAEMIYMGSTGAVFFAAASSTSVNNPLVIADRLASAAYLGIFLYPAYVSGASTGPLIAVDTSPGVATTLFYNGITYSAIVTNLANYLYIDGNSSGQAPGIQALGVDTDIDVQVAPKGAGMFMFNYASIAPGGGAAATLGTVGGSGPGAAAQAKWLKVRVGATPYFIPLWST